MTARTDAPADWKLAPLEQIAQLERGKFSARPRNDPKYYGGVIPFIQTGDVRNSRGRITSYSQTLNERGLKVSRLFPAGTLFMTIAANIGDLGISEFATACPDSLVAVRPRAGVHQQWLYYALSAEKRTLESIATQNAQANLNLAKLNPFLLRVPPRPEQIAIAEALASADSQIADLERLITKRRAIQLGMIQQLLSGNTRVSGFSKPWPLATLGSYATGLRGAGLSKELVDPNGSHACILYGELFTTYGRTIEQVRSRTNAKQGIASEAGDVLVPGSTTTVARDLATASALNVPGVLIGGDTNILRPRDSICSDWLAYYVTYQLGDRIAELAQGTTIKHLYIRDLLRCRIPLPELGEQRAISTILADTEAAISAIRQRLDKAQAVKQGMMQELLIGRTRLRVMETAS